MPRILVVDDNNDFPELIAEYLCKKKNYRVDIANSGDETLKLFPKNCIDHQCYDLIIIDYAMPAMDGLTLAKRIRDLEKSLGWNNAAIIFFTAHADIARVSSCILHDLNVKTSNVYDKLNMWQMFGDIINCFDKQLALNCG